MSFRACTETNDMQLVTTMSHTVTSRETVLTVSTRIGSKCRLLFGEILNIYFTAVGMIDIPIEKEIQSMIEKIRNNLQDFEFVA